MVEFPQKYPESKKQCEQRVRVRHGGSQEFQIPSLNFQLAFRMGENCNGYHWKSISKLISYFFSFWPIFMSLNSESL